MNGAPTRNLVQWVQIGIVLVSFAIGYGMMRQQIIDMKESLQQSQQKIDQLQNRLDQVDQRVNLLIYRDAGPPGPSLPVPKR